MSTIPTPVAKVDQKKSSTDVGQPGQLDHFPDLSWEFTGNGKTSPKEVATAILDYKKAQPPEVDADGNPVDLTKVRSDNLAKMLLASPANTELNKHLNGNVDQPIPAPGAGLTSGQTLFRADGPTLQNLVSELAKHADKLRSGLTTSDTTDEAQRVTGNVRSEGLSLPYYEP